MFLVLKVFFLSLFFSSVLCAAPPDKKVNIPEQIAGATSVDAESLIQLAQSSPDLVIIDSRISDDRLMGYIESSLSLSDLDTNCQSLKQLIPTLDTLVAFYCNGPKCGRSVIATKEAVQCGYKKVYWFKGGFAEWQKKDYSFIVE